ncbi:LysE family translocator [Streptomyces sp. DT190]|jgi:threonine/homoserine/homoserine lactone efflux protein|uniref:LysE family translocator n=1 Tax=unclassified Streptomyces TaxID=2593676 RepID=UPI003CE67424
MDTTTLAAFLAMDLLLVVTPGADWAFAITAGLRDRSVVPAVAGLVAGYAGYTLLAVAGLVVVVAGSATLLTALTVAGAGYLVWLGWDALRRPAELAAPGSRAGTGACADTGPGAGGGGSSRLRVMLKGAGTSGLNPKALLLYFSLFPQFIDPAGGWPVATQTGLLGALHMTACAVVYLAVGVLARTVLRARPTVARAVTRASGVLMIVIGGLLLAERLGG